ncbi:ScbR family autoregulator-binding transcription factor [Rathayibacter sp. YIM 133350]|uniref:ScbR family autoregulator-binding transcription factor n=1 Tax=Rathayibacter sp. YIM 133350 TaxID=3131992 RepID=UPI00307DDD95
MAVPQQQRARETRQRLIEGSARVFARLGYTATALSDIHAETAISKGALYFHFRSKEEVARAVLAEEQRIAQASAERVIAAAPSSLAAAMALCADFGRLVSSDDVVRAGVRLTNEADRFDPPLASPFEDWIPAIAALLSAAVAEGDVRAEVDTDALARFVIPAFTGVQLVSAVLTGYDDLPERLREMWLLLLPGIAVPEQMERIRSVLDDTLPGSWPESTKRPA